MDELKPIENPLEALQKAIAFSSRDWATEKRDAWVYGIILGWDDNCYPEFNRKFGWDKETFERVQRLHVKLEVLCRAAPENKPLTLEQLRQMEGEPVYLVYPNVPKMDGWQILEGIDQEPDEDGDIGAYFTDDVWESLEGYGNDLLAYARKPEQEAPK